MTMLLFPSMLPEQSPSLPLLNRRGAIATSGIKLCKRCQRPIDAKKRADSIYCGRQMSRDHDRRRPSREESEMHI